MIKIRKIFDLLQGHLNWNDRKEKRFSMAEKKAKRWRYYIDRQFQNQFIIKFASIIIISMVVLLIVLYAVREQAYSLLPNDASVLHEIDAANAVMLAKKEANGDVEYVYDPDDGSLDENTFEPAKPYFLIKEVETAKGKKPKSPLNAYDLYATPIIAISVINLVVIVIFSLFFSHKMAGPVRRIKKTLQAYLDEGEYRTITLRKGDHFIELADMINKVMDKK